MLLQSNEGGVKNTNPDGPDAWCLNPMKARRNPPPDSLPLVSRRLRENARTDHQRVTHLFRSCSIMLHECCQQSARKDGGSADDIFHDPRMAGDQDPRDVADMMSCCQLTASWSAEANAVACVLALRLAKVRPITYGNRERVILISLLLAQKTVDDRPLCNLDFPEVFRLWDHSDRGARVEYGSEPPFTRRTPITLQTLNDMEVSMLQSLNFNIYVPFRDAVYLMLVRLPCANQHANQDANQDDICTMMKRATLGGSAAAMKGGEAAMQPFKVLIADDDLFNRMVMRTKLMDAQEFKGLSAACELVENGEGALEKLQDGKEVFDVLIFDEHMENAGGKLKGSQVIRQLREAGCKAVIISCSVCCTAEDNKSYKAAGADICWSKPYPTSLRMFKDLAMLLRHHRHFQERFSDDGDVGDVDLYLSDRSRHEQAARARSSLRAAVLDRDRAGPR
jgi:CheY-like chemotaxis protein